MARRGPQIRLAGAAVAALVLASSPASGVESVFRYSDLPEVRAFAAELEREHGMSRAGVLNVLRRAKKRQDVLDKINRTAEGTMMWPNYRGIFLKEGRIEAGVAWGRKHRKILSKVSASSGVPEHIILGIIGVETYYGKHMGKYLVFESLTTLAFEENRRQKFFRKELREFFLLAHEQKLNPVTLKGSYAGAMGLGQFIPSSYRHWAVDFDNDKRVDLINNPGDAIASVANYLAKHGWKRDLGIAWPVKLARGLSEAEVKRWRSTNKPRKPVAKWLASGEVKAGGLPPALAAQRDLPVSLIHLPVKDGGQYWMGSKNYYAITRYNHSNLYAMAVFELSQRVKEGLAGGKDD